MSVLLPVHTARACIRLADEADAPKLLRYRVENRVHLAPWEPLRDASFYTLGHCAQTIFEGREAVRLDRSYLFLVLNPDAGEILASFSLTNLMRGPFQACLLGYGIAASRQGRGLMHETLQAGLDIAFGALGLHRVMANYLPRNERSGRLLDRLGFEREGCAKRYLQIAGVWEDHVLTARVCPGG